MKLKKTTTTGAERKLGKGKRNKEEKGEKKEKRRRRERRKKGRCRRK